MMFGVLFLVEARHFVSSQKKVGIAELLPGFPQPAFVSDRDDA